MGDDPQAIVRDVIVSHLALVADAPLSSRDHSGMTCIEFGISQVGHGRAHGREMGIERGRKHHHVRAT